MILEVRAREVAASDRSSVKSFRLLKTIPVSGSTPEQVTFDADLYEGQTLLFRWLNAETTHNPKEVVELMRPWFERDKRMLAAWQKTVYPGGTIKSSKGTSHLRGLNGWNLVKRHLDDPNLDLSHASMEAITHKSPTTKDLDSLSRRK